MSYADCCRALGVDRNASWEAVRQAYKDLVKVWHPDRFQSDPELQRRAEQQLQRVNEAYIHLKKSRGFGEAPPEPPPQPPPQAEAQNERPRRRPSRRTWNFAFRWPAKALRIGLVYLTPLVVGGVLLTTLHVPHVESIDPTGQILQVSGQSPMQRFSQWASGVMSDIQSALPFSSGSTAGAWRPPTADVANGTPGAPANGTELLRARSSGGSEIWVSNRGAHDMVATLVDAPTSAPVRAVYVGARNKACIRNIGPGTYNLAAEVGEGWDAQHNHFESKRRTLEKSGQFQCMNLTTGHVTSGMCFDVNPEDGSTRSRNNIVLAAY